MKNTTIRKYGSCKLYNTSYCTVRPSPPHPSPPPHTHTRSCVTYTKRISVSYTTPQKTKQNKTKNKDINMLQFSQFSHSCTMNLYGELGHLIQLCRVWCTHEDRDKEDLKDKSMFRCPEKQCKSSQCRRVGSFF